MRLAVTECHREFHGEYWIVETPRIVSWRPDTRESTVACASMFLAHVATAPSCDSLWLSLAFNSDTCIVLITRCGH